PPAAHTALRQLVDGKTLESAITGPHMSAAERAQLTDQVRRFYQAQNYQLVWTEGGRPSRGSSDLQKVLDSAADHGLPPELYKVPVSELGGEKAASDDQA